MEYPYKVTDKTVRVHWNSHRNLYSVLHKEQKSWKLLCYATYVTLADVKFVVREAGAKKVKDTGVKNVHAFVEGRWTFINHAEHEFAGNKHFQIHFLADPCKQCDELDCICKVEYNPHHDNQFIDIKTGLPITEAPFCALETWKAHGSVFNGLDKIDKPELYKFKLNKEYVADVYAMEHMVWKY